MCVEPYHVVGCALGEEAPVSEALAARIPMADVPAYADAPGAIVGATHPLPEALSASAWRDEGGGLALAVWTAKVRAIGGWQHHRSAEVVRVWVPPPTPPKPRATTPRPGLCRHVPGASTGPVPGLVADAQPEQALRLVLPLTEKDAAWWTGDLWQPDFPAP